MEKEKLFWKTKALANLFKGLARPESCPVLIILKKSNTDLSYSEIYNELSRLYLDEKLNPACVWRTLKRLKEAGLITEKRFLRVNPETGKSRVRFYKLSISGEKVLNWLLIFEEIKGIENVIKEGLSGPFLFEDYFFRNIYIFVNQ